MKFIKRDYITSSENLCFLESNRCNTLDKEKCEELEYTESMYRILKSRVNRSAKIIETNGYLECCELKVFVLNGKRYVGDGQGRTLAVEKLNEQIKKLIANGDDSISLIQIPVCYYTVNSEEEMIKAIILMNSNSKNWSKEEVIRAKIRQSDNPDIHEGDKLVKHYEKLLKLNYSNISDTLWGQGSIKQDKTTPNSITNIWNHSGDFLAFIEDLYIACEEKGWSEKEINSLRSQKFIEAIRDNIYKNVIKKDVTLLPSVRKILIHRISNINSFDRSVFRNGKAYTIKVLTDFLTKTRDRKVKEMFCPTVI